MKLRTNGLSALALTILLGAGSVLAQQSEDKKQSPQASRQSTEQTMDAMMKDCHDRHHKRTDSVNKTAELVERAEKSNDPAQMRAALAQTREMLAEMKNDMDMCMTDMHGAMKGMKMQGGGGSLMSSDRQSNQSGTGEAIDPVCKMKVDPKTAAAQATYKGKTYYFCKAGHKTQFEKNPEQYIKSL